MTIQSDQPTTTSTAQSHRERVQTVVVGGGQAGLSMAYHLKRRGLTDLVVLDAHPRVGDSWRAHWDSMRVFTPSMKCGLPGMPYPGPAFQFPGKDEIAAHLERYAERFELPVRGGVRVDRVVRDGDRWLVLAGDAVLEAGNVVIAAGPFQRPHTPDFAPDLDPRIVQVHSAAYRNPGQLADGDMLVVGAGNSGADIALELAGTGRRTLIAGEHPGQIPVRIESWRGKTVFPVLWQVWSHVLNRRNPVGRRALPKIAAAPEPLIRVKAVDLERAGVERVARIAGVREGLPLTADGRVIDVPNVVWATGYRPDVSWVDVDTDERGEPVHERGVVADRPGLFFLGRLFQFAYNSHTIGGVGRDAEVLAGRIAARVRA